MLNFKSTGALAYKSLLFYALIKWMVEYGPDASYHPWTRFHAKKIKDGCVIKDDKR